MNLRNVVCALSTILCVAFVGLAADSVYKMYTTQHESLFTGDPAEARAFTRKCVNERLGIAHISGCDLDAWTLTCAWREE